MDTALTPLDAVVIVAYLGVALGAGLLLARRSRGTMENFFLSGRSLPWWLAGTSMVATSFAADTPLLITGYTRASGIAGNWRWWIYLVGTLLVVVVYSRLWRRSRMITDIEFMELRYSGAPARWLRTVKACYQIVFVHGFVMGWVVLGMQKVIGVMIGWGDAPVATVAGMPITGAWLVTVGCLVVALIYSEVAGLWGVVATDFVQFGFALLGAIVLAVIVVDAFGGMGEVVAQLAAVPELSTRLSVTPDLQGAVPTDPSTWTSDVLRFVMLCGMVWFATKNADGSGVMVQRILACRDEKHSLGATLWYAVAHNAVRPWPWIIVALASLLVLPPVHLASPVDGTVVARSDEAFVVRDLDGRDVRVAVPDSGADDWPVLAEVDVGTAVARGAVLARTDDEAAYPEMMRRFLPAGWLGLLVASFLAAFMSTIDTHVNVASSYFVNDVYRRHVRPDAPPAHYVRIARITGPGIVVIALVFAGASNSVRGMFDVFTSLFGGVGLVYLMRWCWWRVNAWSEIAALTTSAVATLAIGAWPTLATSLLPARLVSGGRPVFEGQLLLVAGSSLLVALVVTLLTPPVGAERLREFHARVRPPGVWGPVRGADDVRGDGVVFWLRVLVSWSAAIVFVVACIMAPGAWLLEGADVAGRWLGVGLAAGVLAWATLPRLRAPAEPASEDG